MSEQLTITILGGLSIRRDGEPVTGFVSTKAQALVYYLAATGRSHTRDALAGLLWSDVPDATARKNLRDVLSNLRRLIGPYLLITRQTVCLNPEAPCLVDSQRFSAALSTPEDMAALSDAVDLYQGDFLDGFHIPNAPLFDDWLLIERQHLRQALETALERLVDGLCARRKYKRAIGCAQRWLSLDPLRESAHRSLMRLYAWDGDRAAALRQYQECVQVLAEELGVEPAAETVRLYEQIREGELQTPDLPLAPLPEFRVQPPAFLDEEAEAHEPPVFVARERELARLDGFLETALKGQGQVVFVTGGAGRGKTVLIQAFARRAMDAHPDMLMAMGNCNAHSGVGDPYLPFREVLSTLTGDVEAAWAAGVVTRDHARRLWNAVPKTLQALFLHGGSLVDIFIPGPPLLARATAAAPDDGHAHQQLQALIERNKDRPADLAQQQLFDQYTDILHALSTHHPLLLLLDDLQWADAASTGLLFHLGRRLEGARILILSAYRPAEVAAGRHSTSSGETERHPLDKVLAEFKRSLGEVWIDLAQADEAEDRRFVDAFLETEPNRLDEGFRRRLFRHTGGHALFTVELLRAMQERGDLVQDRDGYWIEGATLDWEALPTRVEAVIEERIERLEDELREILTVASVEGEDFTAQVVARIQEIGERQLLRSLSHELERRHRLVREQGEVRVGSHSLSRYRFAHALFQQYLYNGLSGGERRLLHKATAEVLEELYQGRTDAIAVQLAHHWERAEEPEKATEYLLQAGDQARLAYACQEASSYYHRALPLLEKQGKPEQVARTLMKLGLTYDLAFDFQRSRQAYEQGFALWQRAAEAQREDLPPAPHPLRILETDPTTLDPTKVGFSDSGRKVQQIFSGLVELGTETEVVPDVAQSWEVTEGGRKYLFHLRGNVSWSDGTPVTAGDFEYAWKRALDPATGSGVANLLYDVKGARAFHQGEVSDPDSVGVKALDEVTLAVELEGSTGYFLHLLADCVTFPVPRHVVEAHGEAWAEPENIVTNGPFRLEMWLAGERMTLTRNPDYHGRFTGNLECVELVLRERGPSPRSEMFEMYEGDRLDVMSIESPEVDRVRRKYAGEYHTSPRLSTFFLQFDASRPPFDDVRTRRAFVLATDRETLLKVVNPGHFPATGGFVPPGMPGHSPGIALPHDPDQARQLLAEAGYPGGQGFPAVECLTFRTQVGLGENLQAQWRENLGVEIQWEIMEWRAFRDLDWISEQVPHLFTMGWLPEYPDPDNFLRVKIGFIQQESGWRNEGYDSLVKQAQRSLDQEERMKLYGEAERILVEEAPIMPIHHGSYRFLVKPWVTRFLSTGLRELFLKDVIIEPH